MGTCRRFFWTRFEGGVGRYYSVTTNYSVVIRFTKYLQFARLSVLLGWAFRKNDRGKFICFPTLPSVTTIYRLSPPVGPVGLRS